MGWGEEAARGWATVIDWGLLVGRVLAFALYGGNKGVGIGKRDMNKASFARPASASCVAHQTRPAQSRPARVSIDALNKDIDTETWRVMGGSSIEDTLWRPPMSAMSTHEVLNILNWSI